jgi:hypothetical protein
MIDTALVGASVEAMVGHETKSSLSAPATDRAVSIALPPPAPTIVLAPQARADARAA